MTVEQCKEQVLRLLDEVGVNDYDGRIYPLINEAQTEIATQWGFIRKKKMLEAKDGATVALPADCFAIDKVVGGNYELEPMDESGQMGITLSGSETGIYWLVYKAYPDMIDEGDGGRELQLPREYHAALCSLVAALTQDNEYDKRAYQLFIDRYNNQMAMIERAKGLNGKVRVISNGII